MRAGWPPTSSTTAVFVTTYLLNATQPGEVVPSCGSYQAGKQSYALVFQATAVPVGHASGSAYVTSMRAPSSLRTMSTRYLRIDGTPAPVLTRLGSGCPSRWTGGSVICGVPTSPLLVMFDSHSDGDVPSPVAGNVCVRAYVATSS